MIITKTPFRISFFGGGTDYPIWYRENGGSVLSTTIDKYSYTNVRYLLPFFGYRFLMRYKMEEKSQKVSEINHPSIRECLNFLKIERGVEMVYSSDLPARSGIGSSSAFTVGFLNSLYALTGKMVSKKQLALDAIHVEQDLIKENVGSQDQVATAFGGFNRIDFGTGKEIRVQPIIITQEKMKLLQDHLMLFFTGFSRRASEIAGEQIKKTPFKKRELRIMKEMVTEGVNILNDSSDKIEDFGKLLNETWKIKRSLTHLISNNQIDSIYEAGLGAGALGGKLCGAGGGGFMLFFVPPEKQAQVKEKLKGLLYVPFRFETLGSQIIFNISQDFS